MFPATVPAPGDRASRPGVAETLFTFLASLFATRFSAFPIFRFDAIDASRHRLGSFDLARSARARTLLAELAQKGADRGPRAGLHR